MADIDPYVYMLGAPPTAGEQQNALAARLRNQNNIGLLAQAGASPGMAQFGQGLVRQADATATGLGQARRKIDRQALEDAMWREEQERIRKFQQANLALQQRGSDRADERFAWEKEQAEKNRALDWAEFAADQSAAKEYRSPQKWEAEALNTVGEAAGAMDFMINALEEGVKLGSEGQPWLFNTARMRMADQGMPLSEEDRRKHQVWKVWKREFEAPMRHELFGSALTAQEKGVWRQMTLGEELKSDQIQTALGIMRKFTKWKKRVLWDQFDGQLDPAYLRGALRLRPDETPENYTAIHGETSSAQAQEQLMGDGEIAPGSTVDLRNM